MLWVDSELVTLADVLSVDPEITEVAKVEKLVLTGENGLLRRAKEDAQLHLAQFMSFSNLQRQDLAIRNVNIPSFLGLNSIHYAGFAQLVVSGDNRSHWSPVKQWLVDKTLQKIYRAASNRNSDRYQDRYDNTLERIQSDTWPKFRRFGLPLVLTPLPAPGAILERSGTFGASNVSLVVGAGTSTAEVDVAITWVSSEEENNESHPSASVTVTLEAAKVLRVSTLGLTPPDGTQPPHTLASCRYSTRVATGWNVFVGPKGGTLYRQNSSVLPIATADYTLTGNPVFSGVEAGIGQYADINLEISTDIRRA